MKRTLQSALVTLGAVVALAAMPPAPARAQQSADTRWLPWLGCWQASGQVANGNVMVCVRPASNAAGVEVATISDGQTVSQRTLVADGETHELNENGCTGWQRAAFSADGQRAYLRSDLTCAGGVHRTESAIMAMGSPTQWLDVQAVGMDGERVPRVVRYDMAPQASWPEGFELSPQRAMAVNQARVFAAGTLTLADVKEASALVDRDALVAFLIERDQAFDLDAAKLESLARAGVPDQVIDVVVAVSFPNRFHIDRQAMRMALKPAPVPAKHYAERPYYDPFGWGYSSMCYLDPWTCGPYGYGMYGYGLYGFGLGLYSPYGYYGGYGYGPYWYGYAGQPVIIVGGSGQAEPQGQAINGRGYTRGGQPAGTGGRTAHPRGSASQSPAGREAPSSSVGGRRSEPAASPPPSPPRATPSGYTRPSTSPSSGSSRTARPRCCSE